MIFAVISLCKYKTALNNSVYNNQLKMSITTMPGNAIFICEVDDCYVHKFDNRIRTMLSQGLCEIFQGAIPTDETPQSERLSYIRVNDYFDIIRNDQIFVRVRYTGSVCYLFEARNAEFIVCLSFASNAEGLEKFQIQMGRLFKVVDFNSEILDERLRQKIKTNCSDNVEKQDISYEGKRAVRKIGLSIGFIAGKAGQVLQGPAKQAVCSLSDRASRFSEQKISENAKSKWESVKQASSSVNDAMTVAIAPVMRVIDNITSKIGDSFQKSDNAAVKTIRQYSKTICDSLNDGEKKGKLSFGKKVEMRQQNSAIYMR